MTAPAPERHPPSPHIPLHPPRNHAAGHRWKNVPRLDDYLSFDDAGYAPITDHEPPDARRALREVILGGVRIAEGVERARLDALAREAGASIDGHAAAIAEELARRIEREVGDGMLAIRGDRVVPTAHGMNFADGIARRSMAVAGDGVV